MHGEAKNAESQNGGNFVGNGRNSDKNKLTERQRIICDAIKANGNVTAKTLAATLAVSARTIERELNFLRKEGRMEKVRRFMLDNDIMDKDYFDDFQKEIN